MSQKLVDAGEELSTGLHPSLPADRIPFWEDGSNVFWRDGGIEAIPGQLLLCDKLEAGPGVGLIEAELTNNAGGRQKTAFWGNQTKLFRYREGDLLAVDVSRTVGGAYGTGASMDQTTLKLAYRWSFAQWGEWITGTNGLDTPQIYKATDGPPQKFANMTGLNFTRAEIFRRLSVYLVAMNTDLGADTINWCDEDDLTVWTPSQGNSAGVLPLRNLNSPIMAAEDLGENALGIYGRDQLWLASYVGPPNIIGARHVLDGVGAWGKGAVCAIGRNHYGWGPKGIFRTNGVDVEYIDTPSLRRSLRGTFDEGQSSKVIAWPWTKYDTVVFSYPIVGSQGTFNVLSAMFNYANGTWWKGGFGRQAGTGGQVFNDPITVDSNGNIFMLSEEAPPALVAEGPIIMNGNATILAGLGETGMGQLGLGGYWAGTD